VCLRSFILVRFMVQVAEFNESTYDMLHPEKERASSPDCMGGPPAKCYRNSVCVCVCVMKLGNKRNAVKIVDS
jgi:hypothetical protein